MAYFILWSFLVFIVGMVGKLIYDVQQNKKKENVEDETDFELKDKFQTLAGIKQHDSQKGTNDLVEVLKRAEEITKDGFPEPDPSIPVTTAKITTIDTKFEEADPLASVPMSRVSKEAKKKMAEIAKEDINNQLEQNAEKFAAIFPEPIYEIDTNDQRFGIEFVNPKKKSAKKATKTSTTKKKATTKSNKTK